MKGNPDECHLLMSAPTCSTIKIKFNEIFGSDSEKLLDATIDRKKVNFNNHLDKIFRKGN